MASVRLHNALHPQKKRDEVHSAFAEMDVRLKRIAWSAAVIAAIFALGLIP